MKVVTAVSCDVVSNHTSENIDEKHVVKKIWFSMLVVYCRNSFC